MIWVTGKGAADVWESNAVNPLTKCKTYYIHKEKVNHLHTENGYHIQIEKACHINMEKMYHILKERIYSMEKIYQIQMEMEYHFLVEKTRTYVRFVQTGLTIRQSLSLTMEFQFNNK